MVNCYKKSDFSLIEVLVALTIIAIGFSVYMRALSLNIKNTGVAKSYITAILLAKEKLTELAGDDKIKEGEKKGKFGDDYPGFTWSMNIKKQSKYLFAIKLSVSFVRNNSTRILVFNTLSINKTALEKKTSDKNTKTAST